MSNTILLFQPDSMSRAQLAAVSCLARYSGHTHSLWAYQLRRWFEWCETNRLGPLDGIQRAHVEPYIRDVPVTAITPAAVRGWHADLARARGRVKDRPTARAHAYALLRTILNTAVADELISANPCRGRGAGQRSGSRRSCGHTRRARGAHRGDAGAVPVAGAARFVVWVAVR